MLLSIAEEIAEAYFQKKGYFVRRNLPYLSKLRSIKHAGHIDIDVLATNGQEVVIVSCKRGSLNPKQELTELKRFRLAEEFLKDTPEWSDCIKNQRIKKLYVAEYITEHNRKTLGQEVDVMTLKEMVQELIEILKEEMTPKMLDGSESKVLPRILKFIIKLQQSKDKLVF